MWFDRRPRGLQMDTEWDRRHRRMRRTVWIWRVVLVTGAIAAFKLFGS